MSFVDAQIGKILDELEAQELLDSTIVIVWSDHGWHLGDHGMWGKSTCFEWATRSPLFVYVPGMKEQGKPTDALVEYVDLYPTALDLCGLPIPDYMEGTSFVPLLQDASISWKKAAFSQFPRNDKEGYSMRTNDFRYTQWRTRDDKLIFEELYDERENLLESKNVADAPEYKSILDSHREMFARGWKAALPPGVVNRSDLPRGDDSWYYQGKKNREQTGTEKPKKRSASKSAEQTSENKPWIKSFFEKNPAADNDGDGVLTIEEANHFKSKKKD